MNKPEHYFNFSFNQGEGIEVWCGGCIVVRDNGESLAHIVKGTGAGMRVSGHWGGVMSTDLQVSWENR